MTLLTRRNFVGTSTAALLPFLTPVEAQGAVLTRPNAYSSEGKAMLRLYAEAAGVMQKRALGDPTGWTFQWYTHWTPSPTPTTDDVGKNQAIATLPPQQRAAAQTMWNTCQSHGGKGAAWFLPWHRMELYCLEQIVRNIVNNPKFVLPYWDYLAPGQGAIPPEFRDKASPLYFVNRRLSNGSVNGGAVVPDSSVNYDCLALTRFWNDPASATANFTNSINNNPHGVMHDLIGRADAVNFLDYGMSFVPTAARDPIFYLHHCNIDRLWASWNAAGRKNPDDKPWLDKNFTFAKPDRSLTSLRTGDFLSTDKLGYKYEKLAPVPPAVPVAALFAAKAAPRILGGTAGVSLGAGEKVLALAAPNKGEVFSAQLHNLPGAPSDRKYYLVLSGLSADRVSGNHYSIYLGAPANAAGAALAPYYAGTPSFFEAAGMPHAMPGMEMGGPTVIFDVTAVVAKLLTSKAFSDVSKIPLRLVPSHPPIAGANLAIAAVKLVAL